MHPDISSGFIGGQVLVHAEIRPGVTGKIGKVQKILVARTKREAIEELSGRF